jgi:DNA segregation ATPase FtsK/SpoIIIE, S-DNA-T family
VAGNRIALLIATDGYVDPGLSRLRSPARGAAELRAILEDPAIGRFDHVRELTNRPKDEIESALEDTLVGLSPQDLVLLYLSCHGVRNDSDRLFFATVGTRLKRPHATAVHADIVHQLLDECAARTKIVLLDCCYSGLFHRGGPPMSPAAVDVEQALAGRGTFVITASTSLEYAYEGEQLTLDNSRSGSRFTAAVVEGLGTGLADLDRDGVITPDELYTYVHDAVTNQEGPEQTPTRSGQCEGSAVLAYAPRLDVAPGALQRAAPDELLLGSLLPPPVDTPERGFICDAWEGTSRLLVPIGRVEAASGGGPMNADFSGRDGNAAVIGKLGSGKTTMLRTLVTALALTHTPREAEFHLLEGAVNRLGVLRGMPHVRNVAAAHERGEVARVLEDVAADIGRRRALFQEHGIDSVEEFRRVRASGGLPDDAGSDVFLVVDGWLDFVWEDAGFAEVINRLANTGLNYGVHLVLSARRWSDVGPGLLGLLGTRIELALDEPAQSRVDPALAATVGTGWGLAHRRRFRAAVPRIEDGDGLGEVKQALAATAARMTDRWKGGGHSTPPPAAVVSFPETWGALNGGIDRAAESLAEEPLRELLRVPIGRSEDGTPAFLDIGEQATGGDGPHGLVAGAPGSGRAELLRSLVLGLALANGTRALNFVFVDGADGDTFAGLERLPHVAAVAKGLGRDAEAGERLRVSLTSELKRRSELLRPTQRASPRDPFPVARLLVVVENLPELLSADPPSAGLLLEIARAGRSLGVHLLLVSDGSEEGRPRALETHLTYRIALRTSTAAESRLAIGVPDAFNLPPVPGSAYLRRGAEPPARFRAATASVPSGDSGGGTVLSALAARLEAAGPPARPVVAPALGEPPALSSLLPPLSADPDRGYTVPAGSLSGPLTVPIGLVDRPSRQRVNLFHLDLSGSRPNVLVAGAVGSGRGSVVRTLVLSLALTHTPGEARFYCVDLSGDALDVLGGLPHVAVVAGRHDPEMVRRAVAEVTRVLRERRRRAANGTDGPRGPETFLVVRGWELLRREFEDLEPRITEIAREGPGHGVQVVMTARSPARVRPALKELLRTRIELRLADPQESEIDARAAQRVPRAHGRGLTQDGSPFLAALPRLDGSSGTDGLEDAVADAVATVRWAWRGEPAPRLRRLPAVLTLEELREWPATFSPAPGVLLGVDVMTLDPVRLDFEACPFLVAYGERGSGKTSLLRLIGGQLAGDGRSHLVVVDYRRSLLGTPAYDHVTYATSTGTLAEVAGTVGRTLAARAPGPEVTAEQLRARSWWSGPDVVLLVDDHDLLGGVPGNPLAAVAEHLPFARDIGLRIVLARSTEGASRARFEPFTQRLMELGAQGIVLSGDRSEGELVGPVRPSRQPPGRGTLWTREAGPRLVQLAYVPER